MPRIEQKLNVNNFIGGLSTDTHELNTPINVSVDEDNCALNRRGYRERRFGMDFEDGWELHDTGADADAIDTMYIKTYDWESVGNEANRNFLVIQFGNDLKFYDKASDPLSDGEMPFDLDLLDHLAPAHSDASEDGIQVASGKGSLFVTGRKIAPFYIEYDSAANTISTTAIVFRIRDLDRADPDLGVEAQPTTLTAEQLYDYFNQGWYARAKAYDTESSTRGTPAYNTQVLSFYRNTRAKYPPLTKPWWIGKRIGDGEVDVFDPSGAYDPVYAGNTLAPLGHYILDPFAKDRSTASVLSGPDPSGIGTTAGIQIVSEDDRPEAMGFYAGRVIHGFKDTLYVSQLIKDDLSIAGYCYQEADPTSEEISDLIDADGIVIPIPGAGRILSLFAMENSAIIFATNGLWMLGGIGPGEGFKTTAFSVSKISSIDIISPRTLIDVDGNPCWWGQNGIYVLAPRERGDLGIINLLEKKVQNFFDSIPSTAKETASGAYDKVRKMIVWIYDDPADGAVTTPNQYACRDVLNYDTVLGAFYPYTISSLASNSPFVYDVFQVLPLATEIVEELVVDSSAVTVTDSGGASVVILTSQSVEGLASAEGTAGVKYLVFGLPWTVIATPDMCANDYDVYGTAVDTSVNTPEEMLCPFSRANVATWSSNSDPPGGTGVISSPASWTFQSYHFRDFDFVVPAAAIIEGVEVTVKYGVMNEEMDDHIVQLCYGTAMATLGDDNASHTGGLALQNTIKTYGGPADTWGLTLTGTIVATTDFGVKFAIGRHAEINPSASRSANVDWVAIKVYYRAV